MIEIDGSYLEGGGQVVRTAVALSCLTKKTVKITNIREGRKNPGLKKQHMTGVKIMQDLCNAAVKGNLAGSSVLEFSPADFVHKKIKEDVGTAGSLTLILQNVLLGCLRTKEEIELEIIGGTEVKWSPTIDYFENLVLKALKKIGYNCELNLMQRGYYPEGGGKISVKIMPSKLMPFNWIEQETVKTVEGISAVTGLPEHIAVRQMNEAKKMLINNGYEPNIKKILANKYLSVGTSCTLWSSNNFIGSDALGEPGKTAEQVGREAAKKLVSEIKAGSVVDPHLADNLIPYMGRITSETGQGCSFKTSRITNHCKTNIWVTEQFLPVKFEIKDSVVSSKAD